jgi:hypothetical protein
MMQPSSLGSELSELSDDGFAALDTPQPGSPLAASLQLDAAAPELDGEWEFPAERVRFTAPLSAEAPGLEVATGAVVNLSATGLACTLTSVLHDGEVITCRFREALAETPLSAQAEVIWRRPATPEVWLYGMRFVELMPDVRERIAAVVRERGEGRAGEWPLPVLPALPACESRRPKPYLPAAFGVAVGVALALAVSLVSSRRDLRAAPQRRAAVELPGSWPSAAPRALSTAAIAGGVTPAPVTLRAMAASAGATRTAKTDVPAPVTMPALVTDAIVAPEAPVAGEGEANKAETAAAESKPSPKTSPPSVEPGVNGRKNRHHGRRELSVSDTPNGIELTLEVDRPVVSFKTFWLDHPRRLVVDILGAKSGFANDEYAIAGPLASRLRVGAHDDRVRFVIDAAAIAASDVSARPSGSTLVVGITRRRS